MLKVFKMIMIFSFLICINEGCLSSSLIQSVPSSRLEERKKARPQRFAKEKQELQAGILVVSVAPNSAAERAGIKAGDIILRIFTRRNMAVSNVKEFVDFIQNTKMKMLVIMIKRDGRKIRIHAKLSPAGTSPRLGVQISDISPGAQTAKRPTNVALKEATRRVDHKPSSSLSQRLEEINVLKYALIDEETGRVIFIGTYDPRYPSGPIPYYDLLADALSDPYPAFSFDFESGKASFRKIAQFMEPELERIRTDVEYGSKWMIKMGMSILNSKDSMPEKAVFLKRMKQSMGIEPEEFEAYFRFSQSGFTDVRTYAPIESFSGKLLAKMGIEERFGRAVVVLHQAQREVREDTANFETTLKLCGLLGTKEEMYQIRDDLGSNRISEETAGRRLWSLHYGALLKGLGVSPSKVDAMINRYLRGHVWDEELAQALDDRYVFLAREAMRLYVFQSFIFSQDFLRMTYKQLPLVMSGVRLYGRKADSPLVRVMFDADYALKYITSLSPEALSVKGHQFSQEFLIREAERRGASLPDEAHIRDWIEPAGVDLEVLDDQGSVRFTKADLSIGSEELIPISNPTFMKKALKLYADRLTQNYDNYAKIYPSLHTMREAAKIIAYARWLKNNDIKVNIEPYNPVKNPVPEEVKGFVSLRYVLKERGDTDSLFLSASGGVIFHEEVGDDWIAVEHNPEVADDVMRQLAASTALAEQAAEAALEGDLEGARDLAEKSAQAMTGLIDTTQMPAIANVPEPTPSALSVSIGTRAAVSKEVIGALDKNLQAATEAQRQITVSETLRQTSPEQYEEIISSAQSLRQRSEDNLQYLKGLLVYYRDNPAHSQKVIVDLRNLDPAKPATVKLLRIQEVPSIEKAVPKKEKLLNELKDLQSELSRTRMVLMRLNRSVQANNTLFKEWQDEAERAINRAENRAQNFIKDKLSDDFFDLLKWKSQHMPARVKEIEGIEKLISLKGLADWAQIDQHSWEELGNELVSAVQSVPFIGKKVQDIAKSMQHIVNSSYDITAWFVSWRRIQQLEKNSDAYLVAVQKISKRMGKIVPRIKEIEVQLKK